MSRSRRRTVTLETRPPFSTGAETVEIADGPLQSLCPLSLALPRDTQVNSLSLHELEPTVPSHSQDCHLVYKPSSRKCLPSTGPSTSLDPGTASSLSIPHRPLMRPAELGSGSRIRAPVRGKEARCITAHNERNEECETMVGEGLGLGRRRILCSSNNTGDSGLHTH